MMDFEMLKSIALECGLTHAAPLDVSTIHLDPAVREMCASGKCHKYNTNWSCPPACGDLDALRAKIGGYKNGILVQTVGQLEDAFDGEGMMETQALHKENFARMYGRIREYLPDVLALGAGCCERCAKCSYPDAPCRFPEEMTSSMEASGILVLQLCKDNKLSYYYGENTISYTSCFLYN